MTTRLTATALTLAITALAATPAKADQIDGHWCKGLKRLSIDGPNIITPGGTKMIGEYDRHGFRYIVPAGEEGAGDEITMAQQHDELIHLWTSAKPDDTQAWTRCREQIS